MPQGPFLELNFYVHDRPDADAFEQLVRACLELGGRYLGRSTLVRGLGARSAAFDWDEREETDLSLEALQKALGDPDVRVGSVEIENAAGTGSPEADLVTYCSRRKAVPHDQHALAIWTSGDELEAAYNLEGVAESERAAAVARASEIEQAAGERFCELVRRLEPTYATIAEEQSLPTLAELKDE